MQFYCIVLSHNRTCTYVNIGPNFCNRESNQIRIGPLQIKSRSRTSFDWEGNNFRSNTSTFQRTSEMSTDLCTNPLKLTHSDINSSQILYRMYVLYILQCPKYKKSFFQNQVWPFWSSNFHQNWKSHLNHWLFQFHPLD